MIIYFVINKIGTHDYYNHNFNSKQNEFGDILNATKFESEIFAFGVMKQYHNKFLFPCEIKKIYHLR